MNKYQICEFIDGNGDTRYKVRETRNTKYGEVSSEMPINITDKQQAKDLIDRLIAIDRQKDMKLVSCEDYPPC